MKMAGRPEQAVNDILRPVGEIHRHTDIEMERAVAVIIRRFDIVLPLDDLNILLPLEHFGNAVDIVDVAAHHAHARDVVRINKQYYDAAKVDSTPRWRVFTKITVPLLSPMIAYVVITGFIGGFKEYTSIVGIFGETMGPAGDAGRMNTIVGMIYDALPKSNYGVASAAALILFAIIFVVTMINMQVSKKRVHY